LIIALPGLEPEAARTLVGRAHVVCPHSNATRANGEVTFTLA
jgi:osmotically inducible protein OsmC